MRNYSNTIFLILIIFLSIAIGFLFGSNFEKSISKKYGNSSINKLNKLITYLSEDYVDKINTDSLVSVVIDIERIGDYTKNIYDLAKTHPKKLSSGSLKETLDNMENSTKEFLNKAIDAFKNQDIELARSLMEEYKTDISTISNEIVNALVSGENAEFSSDQASALCLYARYLKRIAAHSRNLVSSIVNPFERIGYPE